MALPALAQTAPHPEEVIVTGQRKSETLQKAPVSVTVLSKQVLREAGIKRAADFIALTPGVSIVAGTAEVGDSQVNIRGINSARDANRPSPSCWTACFCPTLPPSTGSSPISTRSRC
jgi:iron complex outermembrane receptor protein